MTNRTLRGIRAAALILCLTLCFVLLPACAPKNDPLAPLGFSSLEIDRSGKTVTATLRLDARTLQQHAGEWLYLYELTPGETTETARGVSPIAAKKVSSAVRFSFDLLDGERSRLYSSFVVGFEDGSLLSHDGRAIDNPDALATVSAPFLWTSSPKGLLVDNVANAAALNTSHAAFELSLSDLLGNTPDPSFLALSSYDFGGVTYHYNESALTALDSKITAATESGMQVSLRLLLDVDTDQKTAAALFSLITDRYHGEGGILSAILLHPETLTVDGITDPDAIAHLAALCRTADLALRSQVSNGRVYVHSDFSMTDTRLLFANLQTAISRGGAFDWGMSVLAEPTALPSGKSSADSDAITTANLDELGTLLSASNRRGAAWISVDLPTFDAGSDTQAQAYAYHYLTAARIKPSMIFYLSHVDSADGYDASGLYAADGSARRLESVYASIDCGLSDEMLASCRAAWGDVWTSELETLRSAKSVSGATGIGIGGMGESSLFDFRGGDVLGFTAVSASGLSLRDSAAQSAPALFLWATPDSVAQTSAMPHASGIQRILPNAASLEDALSLSVHFLAQTATAEVCTLRLHLVGSAPNGTRLVYESDAEVACGSWQTATFQISQFVLDADLSRPVVLRVTVDAPADETEPYPLWFGSILVRTPEVQGFDLTPLILILGGVAVGCVGVLLIYRVCAARAEAKRRRLARTAGRRGSRRG